MLPSTPSESTAYLIVSKYCVKMMKGVFPYPGKGAAGSTGENENLTIDAGGTIRLGSSRLQPRKLGGCRGAEDSWCTLWNIVNYVSR